MIRPRISKAKRAAPVDREGQEQAALMTEIKMRYSDVYRLLFHVPNGGHRHKLVAIKLKEQGVKPGVPDLVLPMARGGYFGLYIEFKAAPPNDAPVSLTQHGFIQALNAQGYLAVVCRGHSDVLEILRAYLLLPATVAA